MFSFLPVLFQLSDQELFIKKLYGYSIKTNGQAERPAVRLTAVCGHLTAGRSPHPLLQNMEVLIITQRKRNVTLSVRLTAKEKAQILSKARQANLPINKYIIACSECLIIDSTDYTSVLTELKRIGNNLNQIARKLNAGEKCSPDFDDVLDGQRRIFELFSEGIGHRWRR